jgi:hypothetical protein
MSDAETSSQCGEVDEVFGPGIGPVCTREKGHGGNHEAICQATGRHVSTWSDLPRKGHPTREQRADRYAGRYFSRPDGSGLFRALRGATGAVLLTVRPDNTQGLTDPDELEALLLNGTLIARPDVKPPESAGS